MKILLKLDTVFFTDEQNQEAYDSMIEIDWDLPFMPNKGDLFDFENIVEKIKWFDFHQELTWGVDYIEYTKINNILTPIVWLNGE